HHRPIFALCLCLTLCGQGLSLGCRWMDHKFSQQSKSALDELRTMGGNYTQNSSGVDFPTGLYEQAEDRLNFMAQVLEEVVHLFEEDWDSMPWPETTVNNFLSVVNQQEEGVRSCIVNQGKKSKKLHMYFKRLSRHLSVYLSVCLGHNTLAEYIFYVFNNNIALFFSAGTQFRGMGADEERNRSPSVENRHTGRICVTPFKICLSVCLFISLCQIIYLIYIIIIYLHILFFPYYLCIY
uniref:Interferon a3-like n=1 Tax=Myripristis murdjan TaxID=586833 RepID=A0A668ADP1_9TELE